MNTTIILFLFFYSTMNMWWYFSTFEKFHNVCLWKQFSFEWEMYEYNNWSDYMFNASRILFSLFSSLAEGWAGYESHMMMTIWQEYRSISYSKTVHMITNWDQNQRNSWMKSTYTPQCEPRIVYVDGYGQEQKQHDAFQQKFSVLPIKRRRMR